MSPTKHCIRTGSRDSSTTSSSLPSSAAEAQAGITAHPSSLTAAAVEETTMTEMQKVVPTSTSTLEGGFTASEKRRQKTLFLADTEQFAFDFGGEATAIAETVVADDAAQRAARRAEELKDTTARVVAASAGHQLSNAAAARPLSVEEVSAFASAALTRGPLQFLTLPRAGALLRRAETTGEGFKGVSDDVEGATLAEAIPQFQAALRRYDEGLWRESTQRRNAEDAQRRSHTRKRQRA